MKPVEFDEMTNTLEGYRSDFLDESILSLPVWRDNERCVSCWQMSFRERLSALLFGRVWAAVLSEATQPPIYLQASKSYFETSGQKVTLRRLWHWIIARYLRKCGSSFHTFPYGPRGRYVVLMDEWQYHNYQVGNQ